MIKRHAKFICMLGVNSPQDTVLFFKGLLAVVSATAKTLTYLDEVQDPILRKDGIAYEDAEAILSNLYRQNQRMEKELRAVAMIQRETMENTDKVVAKLETKINEQASEMNAMKQEIRKLKTNMNEKETILKHVLQENRKCVAELKSTKQIIEHIERVVKIERSNEKSNNAPRKAIIQSNRKVKFSQNSSSRETKQVLDKITSMRTSVNVSTGELQGDDNITTLRKGINKVSMNGFYEDGKHIRKHFRNGKGTLSKRDTATEGVAFSAYLDHIIYHMGGGHTIKCNQVLLNDGNHYNSFTGIFTVPETGVYLLTFNFGVQTINDVTEVRLVVNNREIVDAAGEVTVTSQRSSSSNTAIIKLNQGESVWLESIVTDSEVVSGPSYRWTTFSGVLLY